MAGEVTYTLNDADMTAAAREQFRAAIFTRKSFACYALFLAIGFGLGFAGPKSCGCAAWADRIASGWSMAGFVVVLFMALFALVYLTAPGRMRRALRQQTGLREPVSFAWADDRMTVGTIHGTLTFPWADRLNWTEVASAVVIAYTDLERHIVPRRVLTDAQRADLIATLERSGLKRV